MKQELIILSIDLGSGKDEIHVKSDDTPLALAERFCKKHCLDKVAESSISKFISLELAKLSITPKQGKSKTPSAGLASFEIIPEERNRLVRGRSETKDKLHTKDLKLNKEPKETSLPGQRLYYSAVEKLKEKEQKIEKIIAEREASEVNGLTFRPAINNRLFKDRNKLEDEFLTKHKLIQEKLKSKQLEKAQEEMKDCTFHPTVNRSSSKIDKVKTTDRNLHLYYSAERRKKETPKIKKSKSPDKGITTERVNVSQTAERLMKYKEKYDKNIERVKAEKVENEKFDCRTGRELFKPCINSPRAQRRRALMASGNSSITHLPPYMNRSVKKLSEKANLIQYEEVLKTK